MRNPHVTHRRRLPHTEQAVATFIWRNLAPYSTYMVRRFHVAAWNVRHWDHA